MACMRAVCSTSNVNSCGISSSSSLSSTSSGGSAGCTRIFCGCVDSISVSAETTGSGVVSGAFVDRCVGWIGSGILGLGSGFGTGSGSMGVAATSLLACTPSPGVIACLGPASVVAAGISAGGGSPTAIPSASLATCWMNSAVSGPAPSSAAMDNADSQRLLMTLGIPSEQRYSISTAPPSKILSKLPPAARMLWRR